MINRVLIPPTAGPSLPAESDATETTEAPVEGTDAPSNATGVTDTEDVGEVVDETSPEVGTEEESTEAPEARPTEPPTVPAVAEETASVNKEGETETEKAAAVTSGAATSGLVTIFAVASLLPLLLVL